MGNNQLQLSLDNFILPPQSKLSTHTDISIVNSGFWLGVDSLLLRFELQHFPRKTHIPYFHTNGDIWYVLEYYYSRLLNDIIELIAAWESLVPERLTCWSLRINDEMIPQ